MVNRITNTSFVDLEIHISRQRDESYPLAITINGQQVFDGYLSAGITKHVFNIDPVVNGQQLFDTLFADKLLHDAWIEARGQSAQRRIRLRIDPDAAELHALPWELLRGDGTMLSANGNTPFSRYFATSKPWGGVVEERPIRVLVVISNPADLDDFNLPILDVEKEQTILEEAFSELDKREIQLDFLDAPATLERLEVALLKGYHILHFVGHGIFNNKQQAVLYMQDERGNTRTVDDKVFVGMLSHQRIQPRLVFLAACQSAARSTANAFLGLGPKLVAAGVPAVVAMQESVTMTTARKLSQTFYRRLGEHGIVDCAMNEARSVLLTEGRPDTAVPVLFMRLKQGALWSDEAEPSAEDIRRREIEILAQAANTYQEHLHEQVNISVETIDPYRGLLAYRLQDWPNFFGRSKVIDEMLARISGQGTTSHLVILHAGSGTGKTSLIQAGLMPRLLAEGCLPFCVRGYDEDPITVFKRDLLENPSQTSWLNAMPLCDFLQHIVEPIEEDTTLVIFFDQFEEFFTRGLSQETRTKFVAELGDCLKDTSLPVRFVLSLRDEYFGQISTFAPRIKQPCENEYLMLPLTHTEAREAILRPVERLGLTYEDELVDMLLNDPEWETVAPPQLQVVCKALYEGLKSGERTISRALYADLGGIPGILRGYLERVLKQKLPREHRQVAKHVLCALITPDWQRDRKEQKALADWLIRVGVDTKLLDTVLDELIDNHLIRKVSIGELAEREAYELVHDYLIEKLKPWIDDDQMAARRIQDMLVQAHTQHRLYQLLLDEEEVKIIEHQLRNPYLGLNTEDRGLILISAVDQGMDIAPWSNYADEPTREWVRGVQGNTSHPESLRLAAMSALGRLEDEQTFVKLQTAVLNAPQTTRTPALYALANFVHNSGIERPYPKSIWLALERQLAILRLRAHRQDILALQQTAGVLGALGAALTTGVSFMELLGMLAEDTPVSEVYQSFLVLLVMLTVYLFIPVSFLLMRVLGGSLIRLQVILVRKPIGIQILVLTVIGSLLGFPAFLPTVLDNYGWAAGAIIGATLAYTGRLSVQWRRWVATWVVPILTGTLTILVCAGIAHSINAVGFLDAPGLLVTGLFAGVFIRRATILSLAASKTDK